MKNYGSKISSFKLNVLQSIFENANIESYLWKISKKRLGKVYFISALASATSLNVNIGGILNNPENKAIYSSVKQLLLSLLQKGLRCQMILLLNH
jgi:2-dehydropantoate 2-reductase